MRVHAGLRIGWWDENAGFWKNAFRQAGVYVGPDIGDHLIGTMLRVPLDEGELRFQVTVLFRPDRGKRQRLETVLIFDNYVPEMWEYDDWEKVEDEDWSGQGRLL